MTYVTHGNTIETGGDIMSMDKAIEHHKEFRKRYYGAKFQDSKRDLLRALVGGITPRQSASIHEIFTRIPQELP